MEGLNQHGRDYTPRLRIKGISIHKRPGKKEKNTAMYIVSFEQCVHTAATVVKNSEIFSFFFFHLIQEKNINIL